MNVELKLSKRFELLAKYIGVQPDTLRNLMVQFLNEECGLTIKAAAAKADGWWDLNRSPQKRGKHQLEDFFKKIFNERNKKFDTECFDMNIDDFLRFVDINYSEAAGIPEPYSIFKAYRNAAVGDDYIERLINNYRGYYYLYRIHSTGSLVRDVVQIYGNEQGAALCNIYEYSSDGSQRYKLFHGNAFFSNKLIYITVSTSLSQVRDFEMAFLMIQRHEQSNNLVGIGSGPIDNCNYPSAYRFLMVKVDEKADSIENKNVSNEVKKINKNDPICKKYYNTVINFDFKTIDEIGKYTLVAALHLVHDMLI